MDASHDGHPTAGAPDTIRLNAKASRFGRTIASSPTEILVYPNTIVRNIIGATARLGKDSIVASFAIPDAEAPARIRIGSLFSDARRPLRIEHAGSTVNLTSDGTSSGGLRGLPLSGPWTMSSPLLSGEIMGDRGHAPPATLSATIVARCVNR
jgi:hypothetical protein